MSKLKHIIMALLILCLSLVFSQTAISAPLETVKRDMTIVGHSFLKCAKISIEMLGYLQYTDVVKDDEELKIMKVAATIGRESFITIRHLIKVGAIEQSLAAELEYEFRKRGASGVSFPIIIASGPNSAKAHYSAGSRILKRGDMVVCDFGCKYKKYSSDETNTVSIGRPNGKMAKIYEIVRDTHMEVISRTKCNMTGSEIDSFARDHIRKCGYGKYFSHSTGHSLGLGSHGHGGGFYHLYG